MKTQPTNSSKYLNEVDEVDGRDMCFRCTIHGSLPGDT